MGEVVIRLDGRTLERILYWIIILVLAILLVFSYLGDDSSKNAGADTPKTTETAPIDPEPSVPTVEETEPVVPNIDETCSDDIKNQNEVGVDCGGVCTDINGGYWYDGSCHNDPKPEVPELSGKIEFSLVDSPEVSTAESGAMKVVSFTVKITNGKDDNFFPTIIAHAKDGTVYLNQNDGSYDEDDGDTPYMGPFELDKIASGDSVTLKLGGGSDAGSYTWTTIGSYDPGDDFSFVVELYDDDGEKIDQVSKTIRG